ncbi:hypothetical protein BU24DRAFT_491714 [Aaosphaeria arxii CBS 175.79]|uniref:Uncharacterized protein n=1 Tax=Aaosphaeria arxii CBS 175.79 TaxID=1450172 RepID=A0A6A5XTA2_9PLEO|nr:uncharacterized protein BU24DRAFT_491714 [Aaosphaeria arxii CBS 175.79]KAF2015474.1 hypothetical protein BU24DRAFT_491714 [Aaosphaeria arxii CBS 175.79]
MSAGPGFRRLPSEIEITPPPPNRPVPSPNAFAIAAAREKAEREIQSRRNVESNNPYLPLMAPPDNILQGEQATGHGLRPSTGTRSLGHEPGLTRSSPAKSDIRPYTEGDRHASTARSRHSNHTEPGSTRGYKLSHGRTARAKPDLRTARAHLEAKSEKKHFEMLHQPWDESGRGDYDMQITRIDRTREKPIKKSNSLKSPIKKMFGNLGLPSFLSSNNDAAGPSTPPPPMPLKAAKLLGTDSQQGRGYTYRPWNHTLRSTTSKSLPSKIQDPQSRVRHPRPRSPPRTALRTSFHKKSSSRDKVTMTKKRPVKKPLWATETPHVPPTPPAKDTPPDVPENMLGWTQSKRVMKDRAKEEYRNRARNGDPIPKMPNFYTTAPLIPEGGGESPTKFVPYTAEDYAKLIEAPDIMSARGEMGYATNNPFENSDNEQEPENEQDEDDMHPALRQEKGKGKVIEQVSPTQQNVAQRYWAQHNFADSPLKPRFFTPTGLSIKGFEEDRPSRNADPRRLLFTVPAPKPNQSTSSVQTSSSKELVEMMFKGDSSEINMAPGAMDENKTAGGQKTSPQKMQGVSYTSDTASIAPSRNEQASKNVRSSNGSQFLQPDPSSSRLTAILDAVSPSKAGYSHNNSDAYASCPSAVPSPLHHQAPHLGLVAAAMQSGQPLPVDSNDLSNIYTHFFMCNEHIDVVGRTLFDAVINQSATQYTLITTRHNDMVAKQEAGFKEVQSNMTSTDKRIDDVLEKQKAIEAKMDKVIGLLKSDVAEPLSAQNRKNTEMQKRIEDLRKEMVALRTSLPSAQAYVPQGLMGPPMPLPNHRSQPSLAYSYDPVADSPAEGHRMPPAGIFEMTNHAYPRFGQGYTSGNNGGTGTGNGTGNSNATGNSNNNGINNGSTNSNDNNFGNGHAWRNQNAGSENKDRYASSNPYHSNNGAGHFSGGNGSFYGGMPSYYSGSNGHDFSNGGTK